MRVCRGGRAGGVVAALAAAAASAAAQEAAPTDLEQEILVVAARREQEATLVTPAVTTFREDDLVRRQAASVADLLREAPGAYVAQDGPQGQFARVFLRGAASNQTLVVVDGVPQNDATAGGVYDFGDLSVTGVERIEVLRGSYSVLYGSEAIGGVVSVTTRRGRGPLTGYVRVEGGAFGTHREEAAVSQGDAERDFAIAIGDHGTRGELDREDFHAYDGVGRFGLAFSDRVRLDASVRTANSRVESPYDFASSGVLPPDGNIDRRRTTVSPGATLTVDAADWLSVRAVGSWLRVESDFANGSDGPEVVDPDFTPGTGDEVVVERDELLAHNVVEDLRGRIEATATALRQATGEGGVRTGLGLDVTAGGEVLGQRSESATTSPDFGAPTSSTTRIEERTTTRSLFAQAEVRLPDVGRGRDFDWEITPRDTVLAAGLRGDDHSVFGGETSPYVGLRSDVLTATVRSSWGQGFRAPKPSELDDPYVGNRDLGPETSESFDVGASRAFLDGRLALGATWFRLRVDDLIAYDVSDTTPDRPYGRLTNFARTETTGFEYEASADLGEGFRVRGTYTTQNPRDRDTGAPLPNRARRFGSAGVEWRCGAWRVSLDGFFSGANGGQGGEFTAPDHEAREHPGRRNLVDLTARWQASDAVAVFGGVRNLLDDEWVATPSSPAGTGAQVFLGAQVDF